MRTTAVMKYALTLYYQLTRNETMQGPQRLIDSAFTGCYEAGPSLSSNYKVLLTESLNSGDILSTEKGYFHAYRWKQRPFNNLLQLL